MLRLLPILAVMALMLGSCDSASDGATQHATGVPTDAGSPPPALPGQIVRFKAGTPLPQLTFADSSGATLNTADLEGTPVLLNLWATWCAPCVIEMPTLEALAAQMEGELKVLTVSQDVRGAQVVQPFFAQRDFTYLEQWLDPDALLNDALNEEGLMPVTILFDAQGKEVLRVAGGYEWDSEDAIAAIREALAERPVN